MRPSQTLIGRPLTWRRRLPRRKSLAHFGGRFAELTLEQGDEIIALIIEANMQWGVAEASERL